MTCVNSVFSIQAQRLHSLHPVASPLSGFSKDVKCSAHFLLAQLGLGPFFYKLVIAERLSVRLIIVQVRRALVGS